MDFSFTEAQKAVTELSSKIFTDRVTPKALKVTEEGGDAFFGALWVDLATTGLLSTALPESVGGSGHGFLELCSLLVEAGAAVAPIPLWPTLVLGAMPIAQFGSDEQKARLLGGVASGEAILTAALAEPNNDDPLHPTTTARRQGESFVLNGAKFCVPAGHLAKRILVPATVEGSGGGVGLFLLDPDRKGTTKERAVATTLEPQLHLTFSNAPIAAEDVLVGPEHGAAALDWLIQRAVVGLCAMELGVVERVLRMTAQYTTTRQQFERPIATFQAVAQRAADAFIDVETVRLAMWQAAWRLSEGLPATKEVAMAKYWACEAGHRVVYAAQHLHAGIGFDLDYPLHRYYLWSKQIELTLGSASTQLAKLGAEIAA